MVIKRGYREKVLILALVPTTVLLPFLWAPIPTIGPFTREQTSYFQSLAFARDGFTSYTYLTPEESYASLHSYEILSSPLLATGFLQGGRLVSLIAAVAAAVFVALTAAHYGRKQTGLIAVGILWASPMFVHFAGRFWPEAFSVAATAGAVFATVRFTDAGDRRWYAAALGFLVLGITSHMWEASVALAMVVLLLYHRRIRASAGVVLTTGLAVFVSWYGTELQPTGASALTDFGVYTHPFAFFDLSWWITPGPHPVPVFKTLVLPVAILLFLWSSYRALQTWGELDVLLASWLASGIAIPVLLPGGYNHLYYVWAILAPVALAGAVFFLDVIAPRLVEISPSDINTRTLVAGAIVLLIATSLFYSIFFELGVLAGTGVPGLGAVTSAYDAPVAFERGGTYVADGEAAAAGKEIRALGVDDSYNVIFVGKWGANHSLYQRNEAMVRVLAYAQLVPKEKFLTQRDDTGPRFAESVEDVEECPDDGALVKRVGGNHIEVEPCS